VDEESGQDRGEEHSGTRRQALGFLGIDPATGKQRTIQLAYEKIKALKRLGPGKMKDAGYLVPEVLLSPTAIFKGLTLDSDEPQRGAGWFCYAGLPTWCFEHDGRQFPAPKNRVFLVFVNDEWIAYNWYWCAADPDRPELPKAHAERFRERVL
jgi:hypothetical protein